MFSSFYLQRGFFSQGLVDGLDVRKAYLEAKAARDGFMNITVEFEVSVGRTWLLVVILVLDIQFSDVRLRKHNFHFSINFFSLSLQRSVTPLPGCTTSLRHACTRLITSPSTTPSHYLPSHTNPFRST